MRALLASGLHTGHTPPDVVARLDDTLATLHRDRGSAPGPRERAPVVRLAARGRRTAATALLAAAAAVVVGVGVGQLLPSDDDVTSAGSESADSGGSAAQSPGAQSPGAQSPGAQSAGPPEASADSSLRGPNDTKDGEGSDLRHEAAQEPTPAPSTLGGFVDLTDDATLERQVRALRRTAGSSFSAAASCALSDAGPGEQVGVTVDGQPGVVVFRAPAGSTQRVEVFLCDQPAAVRSLRLRAR